jgi:putative ABC transport system ATP-binding protein
MTATANEPSQAAGPSGPAGAAESIESAESAESADSAESIESADSIESAGPIVRLDDVRKDFGDTAALDGVTLHIRQGEAVAVMGPSGCGKSTLLNLVAGLDRPSSGQVFVHGEDLGALNETGLALFRRRRIGMIFQFFNLIDDLPALDNVALAAQLSGVPAGQARRRALELLGELGIADRKNTYPQQLSGGERQRVAVARALMNRPALLLADEPTGALDSRSGEQVMDLLIDLNQLGQTLLMVTHDPRLAARCASRLVEVADGRIVAERALERTA